MRSNALDVIYYIPAARADHQSFLPRQNAPEIHLL
jgi:hypothetical protein